MTICVNCDSKLPSRTPEPQTTSVHALIDSQKATTWGTKRIWRKKVSLEQSVRVLHIENGRVSKILRSRNASALRYVDDSRRWLINEPDFNKMDTRQFPPPNHPRRFSTPGDLRVSPICCILHLRCSFSLPLCWSSDFCATSIVPKMPLFSENTAFSRHQVETSP